MPKYHGRKGVVYMSTTGSGNAVSVGALTEWSMNQATDRVDVTAFGSANKEYVQGLKDITGAFSGFWQDNDETLFTAADSADGVKLYLYPSSDAPARYFYGPSWCDLNLTTGVSAAVAVSGSFAANGAWGRKMS